MKRRLAFDMAQSLVVRLLAFVLCISPILVPQNGFGTGAGSPGLLCETLVPDGIDSGEWTGGDNPADIDEGGRRMDFMPKPRAMMTTLKSFGP